MSASDPKGWDRLLAGLEDDLAATPDAELVAEAGVGEVAALSASIAGRLARHAAPARPRRAAGARLPRDPAERRALLRLMLARPAARRLAVGFAEGRDLPDQEVETLLRRLLATDKADD